MTLRKEEVEHELEGDVWESAEQSRTVCFDFII